MANKKNNSTKTVKEESILVKIGGKVGTLAGKLVAGKDHLVELAGEAIGSVKSKIHPAPKKKSSPAKKAAKAVIKKKTATAPAPAAKKKAKPAAAKKIAPSPKTEKRVAVKAAKKK